jgi:hypothetical protein
MDVYRSRDVSTDVAFMLEGIFRAGSVGAEQAPQRQCMLERKTSTSGSNRSYCANAR